MKNKTLLATLAMVGTIIGAGIFAVPYVFSRAGVPVGLVYIVLLGASAVMTHGFYARIVAATPGRHRLVGYVRRYLGPGATRLVSFTNPLGLFGALLAYNILGGLFLSTIFDGVVPFWTVVFFLIMALLLALPYRRVAPLEALFTWALLAIALFIIALVSPKTQPAFLFAVHPAQWFLPYGVIFFSLGGASAVPDMVESLGKNIRRSLIATTAGTLVAVLVTALFGAVVAGATGAATTEDAIGGLIPLVGRGIVMIGAAFGLLAIATSYITIADNLKEQFEYDFKFSPAAAWCVTASVPLIAYLAGARSFIGVVGFVGAVFGVIDGVIIMLIARRVIRGWLRAVTVPIIVLFLLGIVAEMIALGS